jgi:hypothetical protein
LPASDGRLEAGTAVGGEAAVSGAWNTPRGAALAARPGPDSTKDARIVLSTL